MLHKRRKIGKTKEFVLTLCVIQQWRLFCPLRCVDSSFPVAFFFLFSRTLFFDLVCLSFDYVPQVTFVFVPSFFSGVELVRCVECCCIHSASCRIWSSINMKPKTSSSASWWLPSSSSSSGRKTKARTHKEVRKPLKRVASNPPQHLVSLNFEVCQRLVRNHGLSLSNLAWQFERKAGNQQRRCRNLQKNSGSTAAFFFHFCVRAWTFVSRLGWIFSAQMESNRIDVDFLPPRLNLSGLSSNMPNPPEVWDWRREKEQGWKHGSQI